MQSNAFHKSDSTQLHFVLSFGLSIMFSIIVAIASLSWSLLLTIQKQQVLSNRAKHLSSEFK
jgi:hypothetical protein